MTSFTFWPLIREEWHYRFGSVDVAASNQDDFWVQIPSVKIDSPIIPKVDPFNPDDYEKALDKGVAHATQSHMPGEGGSVYLFAHSSEAPWKMTRQNTAFYRLSRAQEGDEIVIGYQGREFNYRIREKKTVWPAEVGYLLETEKDQLVLQTCTPIGTDFKRLLVFADPVISN